MVLMRSRAIFKRANDTLSNCVTTRTKFKPNLIVTTHELGREGDASVFNSSVFMQLMENEERGLLPSLGLPRPTAMPFSGKVLPFVFVGDEAFPLKFNMMWPYPGRGARTLTVDEQIFNLRYTNSTFCLITYARSNDNNFLSISNCHASKKGY